MILTRAQRRARASRRPLSKNLTLTASSRLVSERVFMLAIAARHRSMVGDRSLSVNLAVPKQGTGRQANKASKYAQDDLCGITNEKPLMRGKCFCPTIRLSSAVQGSRVDNSGLANSFRFGDEFIDRSLEPRLSRRPRQSSINTRRTDESDGSHIPGLSVDSLVTL
jgi:hypothetical protein